MVSSINIHLLWFVVIIAFVISTNCTIVSQTSEFHLGNHYSGGSVGINLIFLCGTDAALY
jgi:hypothetical protein